MAKKNPSIWRPYTQHQTMAELVKIKSGKGAHLYTEDGREIMDLISSWWVNVHGHAHPKIAKAIAEQAHQLEHVIFAGFTHEPAEQLADGLLEKMGAPFEYVFYSDNGSTAVEVALKMAFQFAINTGQPMRKKVIAFEGGFHGDTWAAMAAGKSSGFFDSYQELLNLQVLHSPFPATFTDDPEQETKEAAALEQFDKLLEQQGDEVAAVIIEPLIQGASGMRFCRTEWLEQVVVRAQQRGVKVVFDEVMTGFGRTGRMFAYEYLQSRPDIVCLSKGITGGFMPLSATIATGEVYDSFLGDTFAQALSHGHSYAGNPIACACAVASLALFETEATLDKINAQSEVHSRRISGLPGTKNSRVQGAIAACEIAADSGYASPLSVQLRQRFLDAGLLLRPLGNTLYFLPPACLEPTVLDQAYDQVEQILATL